MSKARTAALGGLTGGALFVAIVLIAAINFGVTLLFAWLGLNVIADFDLSFEQLAGLVIAGQAIAGGATVNGTYNK